MFDLTQKAYTGQWSIWDFKAKIREHLQLVSAGSKHTSIAKEESKCTKHTRFLCWWRFHQDYHTYPELMSSITCGTNHLGIKLSAWAVWFCSTPTCANGMCSTTIWMPCKKENMNRRVSRWVVFRHSFAALWVSQNICQGKMNIRHCFFKHQYLAQPAIIVTDAVIRA